MTKKLLSLLVAALMVLALVPMGAFAKGQSVSGVDFGGSQKMMPRDRLMRSAVKSVDYPAKDDVVLTDLIIDQDFETSMTDWWTLNADGNTATYNGNDWSNWRWLALTDSDGVNLAHGGEGALYSVSWWGSAFDQDNWVATPEITIPAAGYCLSYYASSLEESYPDHLQVLVGEPGVAYEGTNVDTSAWVSLIDRYEVPAEYQQKTIDLSDYAGKTITIAFRHQDNNQYGVALDDIQVGLGEGAQIIEDTGVTISNETMALDLTAGAQLTASVTPADATYQTVTWSSSDPSVVAVNNIGGIVAMGVGTATVTASSHSGNTATCTVTVSEGSYEFMDDLVAYNLYDIDNETSGNFYAMDRFGTAVLEAEATGDLLVSEYDINHGILYGYESVTSGDTETYNFVSYDVTNDYAKTTVTEGLEDFPVWMAYDYENDVMYGAFYYQDSSQTVHFDIAAIVLGTGLEGDLLIDTYNEPYDDSSNWEFVCSHGTYWSEGYFLVYYGGMIIWINADYNGEGFAMGYVSSNHPTLKDQVGAIGNYYQKMWLNPADGMLYWATVNNAAYMLVTDLESGVTVNAGVTGPEGAVFGMECTALFIPYTFAPATHTVTFVDGLTNEQIAQVTVNDGEAATAPEAPEHEGYHFTGWDVDFSNVTSDLTVTALYEINQYLVTFVDWDGTVISKDYVNHGSAATAPADPEREGYTFIGWDVDFSNVTGDLTVTAMYEENEVPPTVLIGDVNCDGVVTASDISSLFAYVMNAGSLSEQALLNADIDGNGTVNATDASLLAQMVFGS